MKTIVVAVQKGGAGKTTLVSHLGVAIELAGDGPAALIDTDPQQTLATWWNLRQAEAPKLANVDLRKDLAAQLAAVASMGFKYCLIDTPPALNDLNEKILRLADLVVIPTRPSPNDLWTLQATLGLVRKVGKPFVFALTQAKPNARVTLQTVTALSAYGQVLKSIINDRVGYADSMSDGRTALEVYPSSPAAQEVTDLWANLKTQMGDLANVREIANHQHGELAHA